MSDVKMTPHTQTVLRALLGHHDNGERRSIVLAEGLYGLELSRLSRLPNGTLFPILERLRQAGWVERYWEPDEIAEGEGRPRRRFYRISSEGAAKAPHALAEARAAAPARAHPGPVRPGVAGGTVD
ncbi:PadR family transcriptional regulator [Streptomyces ossamyceticus]|uniref:PadR family transcriptional regulator n=1 Tax=Streptomyces ossamyceticus TaxID=249581 RepID=UPI000A767FCB|nr:helix-turn-helix transcriptional regulator [Streptomyces ossamyceticus]